MRREGLGAKEKPGQPSLDDPHPQKIDTRSLILRLMRPVPAPFSNSDPSRIAECGPEISAPGDVNKSLGRLSERSHKHAG